LGVFSPFERFFSLGNVSKIAEVDQFLSATLFLGKSYILPNFDKQNGWSTLSAIFSQTHLVALVVRMALCVNDLEKLTPASLSLFSPPLSASVSPFARGNVLRQATDQFCT
jgi:uncharacterized protein (DUF2344 family)